MITLIAEKPSVGMDLARITGCRTRKDGYMDGGHLAGQACRVTWAFGHLLEIAEDDRTASLHWKKENLPIIPAKFILRPRRGKDGKPDPGVVKQLGIIKDLFATTDTIVNCGDAGREGELIQRYIYQWCGEQDARCLKPVQRLWISSLTDEAIHEGLRSLRPSSEFDNLYLAGKARADADWLVGINATEALTLHADIKDMSGRTKVLSLGRVQTPTLALVCARYNENRNFKPEEFFTVRLHTEYKGVRFHVTSEKKFKTFGEAESLAKRAGISLLQVTEAEHKAVTVKTPLLHDQTSAQQEAARRWGYTPAETLAVIQGLYERKILTYPRTGSRFISRDVLRTVPQRIATIAAHAQDPAIRAAALRMSSLGAGELGKRSVNDTKVTDHHALLVEKTDPGNLSGKELNIYNMIAERMLEAFGEPCETDVLSCTFTCAGETFKASSTRIVKPGWKAVRGVEADKPAAPAEGEIPDPDTAGDQTLPELKAGDMLSVHKAETLRGHTKPKPLYTYTSLLEAMKTAGRDSDDDEVKAALKDIGIGTAATRAGIIEILMKTRRYIKEEGKKIVPTETGMEVYNIVKDMAIADVAMTGRWETALAYIEDGKMQESVFRGNIEKFTGQIVGQIFSSTIGSGFARAAEAENITCPLCGAVMKVWETNVACTNKACGLSTRRTVAGKCLSPSTMKHLLENGKTGLVKGFRNKEGKSFDARLKLVIIEKEGRKYGNTEFVFDDKKFNNKKPWKK